VVNVKFNSIPTNTKIKGKNSTRAWENTKFKSVASQIAKENEMDMQWESDQDPEYKRTEQMDQSDLAYLQDNADDCGLAMKVADNKIIFFDEEAYEAKPPIDHLIYGFNVLNFQLESKLADTCSKSSVDHLNAETGQLIHADFQPELAPNTGGELVDYKDPGYKSDLGMGGGNGGSRILRYAPILRDVPIPGGLIDYKDPDPSHQKGKGAGGDEAAMRKAKKLARQKNKGENKATFHCIGNPLYCAGKTFMVEGFGRFDGKWIADCVTHKIGSANGYTTDLELTRCLKGY
jgi:phage protein D